MGPGCMHACSPRCIAFTATITYISYILSMMPIILKLPEWLRSANQCRKGQRGDNSAHAAASDRKKISTAGMDEIDNLF